jgi:hypothetical protein
MFSNLLTFLSAIDELASVQSLCGDHQLLLHSVFVRVTELNDSQWGTTARIVDDVLDDASNVTVTFGKIHGAKFGRPFAMFAVRFENASSSFALCANTTSHISFYFCVFAFLLNLK